MDFNILKTAADEIVLDDIQKEKILLACRGKKRRRINYKAIAAAAAILVITLAVFSPGFLMKAGAPADSAENQAAVNDFYAADEDINFFSDQIVAQDSNSSAKGSGTVAYSASSLNSTNYKVFAAGSFRSIYSIIPEQFYSLVTHEEFSAWSASVISENGMAIMQFVEHFGISRDDFEKANKSYAKAIYKEYGTAPLFKSGDYREQEKYEIFDPDLIYSFDRTEIDEYYAASLYNLETGSGCYENQVSVTVPSEYYQ